MDWASPRQARGPRRRTGLGLAICKGIVEAYGGRIRAESDGLGQGARFVLTLPAVAQAPAQRVRPVSSPQQAVQSVESILVMDDDPQTLRYVRRALADAGYNPVLVADERVLRNGQPLAIRDREHLQPDYSIP